MNLKKRITQVILLIYILTVLSSFALFSAKLLNAKTIIPNNNVLLESKNPDIVHLKTSYAANLTGFPIYIDDSDPNYNWSKTAEENVWLEEADGTSGDPYIIENILINNLGSKNSSIIIKNSNVVFKIKNCYLYNTDDWGYDDDGCNGIYLYNVQNGIIINNNLSACGIGIRVENSEYNSISSNSITYNSREGVLIDGSSYNTFYNNTVSHNHDGISLLNSNYNKLDDNIIVKNTFYSDESGIYLYSSDSNNLTDNIISFQEYRAIWMRDSDLNILSDNSIFTNGMGICVEYSSGSNIFTGNNIFNHTGSAIWYDPFEGVGIYCTSGNNNIFDNNDIYDNLGSGIDLRNVGGFNITNNNLWSNLNDIYLKETSNFKLANNIMVGSGLFLDITSSDPSGIDIDTTNTVNGKPIFFYYNQDFLNSGDFINAGQIFLYSCDHSILSNLDFPNVTTGITLRYCNDNTISDIDASYNSRWGIRLYNCFNNDLSLLNVLGSGYGIGLEHCSNNQLNGNTVSYNIGGGIDLVNCSINTITGNLATYNTGPGLALSGANHSYIYNNSANYNEDGITVFNYGDDVIDWIEINGDWMIIRTFWSCIQNLTFLSNIAIGNAGTGISIDSVNNSIITENIANNNARGIGITDTLNCLIYENQANENDLLGIGLSEGLETEFYNNSAEENYSFDGGMWNPEGYGFSIIECESVDVYNNYAFKNFVGMLVSNCRDCDIKENILNKNGEIEREGSLIIIGPIFDSYGLLLHTCEFTDVFKNSINNNYIKMINSHNNSLILNDITWGGFILENCNQNVILGNSIYRGDRGVDLKDSSYNQILNNTIISMQCFREWGNCIGNIFENNYCKEELPYFFLREIMSIIGIAGVLGLNIPLYLKKRKSR